MTFQPEMLEYQSMPLKTRIIV